MESRNSGSREWAKVNIAQHLGRLPRPWPGGGLGRGLGAISLILALWTGYVFAGEPVTLIINDQPYQIRIHRRVTEAVIQEMGLNLEAEDVVQPPLGSELLPGQTVTIQLARPVTIEADGRTRQLLTQHQTVAALLAEIEIVTNPRDEILIEGEEVPHDATLPPAKPRSLSAQDVVRPLSTARMPRSLIASTRPEPIHLILHRAIPVSLHDGQLNSTFYTTQPNIGEALLEQGTTLFLGDNVTPSLGTPLSPGMRIYIERSTPVNITVDGRTIKTRTHRETVSEVLAQEGIALIGQDFSRPHADHSIAGHNLIEVVRVREVSEIEQELLAFETHWVPDPEMELDRQEIRQTGTTGVIKTRTRIRYENEQEVWRNVEDEWLDQQPSNRVIAYGTKIVVRTLDTEDGPIEYWRKIPMLATAYSAATSGKAPDHPRYGITRSGLPVRYGMVAVDPKVIPLMTELYIPDYGSALAADTGGLVLGKRIDLAYEEDQPIPDVYDWRDVYVLTPIPRPDQIRYVLPQWPQQP